MHSRDLCPRKLLCEPDRHLCVLIVPKSVPETPDDGKRWESRREGSQGMGGKTKRLLSLQVCRMKKGVPGPSKPSLASTGWTEAGARPSRGQQSLITFWGGSYNTRLTCWLGRRSDCRCRGLWEPLMAVTSLQISHAMLLSPGWEQGLKVLVRLIQASGLQRSQAGPLLPWECMSFKHPQEVSGPGHLTTPRQDSLTAYQAARPPRRL